MRKETRVKINEFFDSTIEALLALAAIAIDALFWIGWAYITKLSGNLVTSLQIDSKEVWPYLIAQWCGCGVLALFAVFRTLKDVISLYDSFAEYLKKRKQKNRQVRRGKGSKGNV